MPFQVPATSGHLHIVGDSLPFFGAYQYPGGMVDQINRQGGSAGIIASVPGPGAQMGTSGAGATTGLARPSFLSVLNVSTSAVIGNRIADIDVPTRITAFAPITHLLMAVAVNDANLGTVPATFFATYQALITAAFAANPTLKQIGMVNALCIGELYNAAPANPWGLNAKDAAVAAINAQIDALAIANPNCFALDVHQNLGLWLQNHNPAAPPGTSFGLITYDMFHPTALGQVLMGNFLLSQIQVVS